MHETEPKAVILTALSVEYSAVRTHLNDIREISHKGTIYEIGTFKTELPDWSVLIAEVGAGNNTAAFEAERAIEYFKPSIVLFVGVAGGVKDANIGDVVVATKIYGYESGKAEKTFKVRPNVGESNYSLIQRARAESRKSDWYQRLDSIDSHNTPKVYVGPIAAGEKLIVSTKSSVYKFLKNNYNDTLAIEMEGRGFIQAVNANENVKSLVIRGISDQVDNKSDISDSERQVTASKHASAFAFQLLSKF